MESKNTEQRLKVLTHQNQQLAVQLEEKRKASKALEDKVAAYEQKEQQHEQTLLCVNRVWSQLTSAISHLCSSLAGHADLRPPATAPSGAAAVRDPFLQRLISDSTLTKPFVDSQKRLDAELTDVEQALQERARECKDGLAAVLDAMRTIHSRQEEHSSKLRDAAGASAPQLQADNVRLVLEATALRRELDALRAQHTCASDELHLAEDRRVEAEERIRKLQNELADTEQELTNVQKKYFTLKNIGGGAAGAVAASDGSGPSRQSSLVVALPSLGGVPSVTNGSAATVMVEGGTLEMSDEVAELQALLAKRTADLEREREGHLKTKRWVGGFLLGNWSI